MDRLKKVASFFCTLLLLLGLSSAVGKILTPNFIGDAFNTISAFYKEEDNSLDVLVYGSSHAWKGFDTEELEEICGVKAWNYGCNWQSINTTRLFLEDSLIDQQPKVVVIEAYKVGEVLQDVDLIGEIYYTNALRKSDYKKAYLKQCFGEESYRYIGYHFPLIAFHENWESLNVWNFVNPTDSYDFTLHRGYLASENTQTAVLSDPARMEPWELSGDSLQCLEAMVELCEEKNIQVIFYTAPYQGEYHYAAAMERFASSHDHCVYVNLFEAQDGIIFDGATDFQDSGHLNDRGAKKTAKIIGGYLLENHLLD